ncbi:hypothetical protein BH10PLA1_BH10PLA1_01590 [soil metagenome]
MAWLHGRYIISEADSADAAKESAGSNCIKFTGNTASSIVIDNDGKVSGGWTGVAGVQIVETKQAADEKPAKK